MERVQGLKSCGLLWRDEPMVHVKFGSNLDILVPFFNSNRLILAKKAENDK